MKEKESKALESMRESKTLELVNLIFLKMSEKKSKILELVNLIFLKMREKESKTFR